MNLPNPGVCAIPIRLPVIWCLFCDQFRPFTTFPSSVKTWLALPSSAPLAKLLGICAVLICRNDGTEFGGSIYQKVNKKLETAVNLAWTAGNSNTRFGIAAKYQIDPDACFSVGACGIMHC